MLKRYDVFFAILTISLMPGLSTNCRVVAAAIIDHFNRNTGQCDPSIIRLSKLAGIDRATVLRAVKELHKLGVILRFTHGGKNGRTRYFPNWEFFRAYVAAWNERKKTIGKDELGSFDGCEIAEQRSATSQDCYAGGRSAATQTESNNWNKEKNGNSALFSDPVLTAENLITAVKCGQIPRKAVELRLSMARKALRHRDTSKANQVEIIQSKEITEYILTLPHEQREEAWKAATEGRVRTIEDLKRLAL